MSSPPPSLLIPTPGRAPLLDAATLSLPTHVAFFSIHSPGRRQTLDASALALVAPPPLPSDLNAGYPDAVASSGEDCDAVRVDEVVTALLAAGVDVASLDVVTYRNNLMKIGGTAIDPRSGWCVDAVAVKSQNGATSATVFLDIVKQVETQTWPDADRYVYFGYKFESLAAAAGTGTQPAPARVNRSEFATVAKRQIGGLMCAVAGETDGFDATKVAASCPEPPPGSAWPTHSGRTIPPSSFLELKTLKWPPPHARGAVATLYNVKCAKWWWQTFVCGIPTVILGGRDGAGMLTRVDAVAAAELPGWAAARGGRWTPEQIVAVASDILRFIVDTARAQEGQALRFEYVPASERGVLGRVTAAAVASDAVERLRRCGF